jgi:ABC-type transport system involved in multi-copper enzyme maturation permease subunit
MGTPVGWFGRTFGGPDRLAVAGAVGWLAGAAVLAYLGRGLAAGPAVLLAGGWLLVLALLAREPARRLFGPVFFYDAVRVARQRPTFLLRWVYALGLGLLLELMYYSWLLELGWRRNPEVTAGIHEASRFATAFFHTYAVVQWVVVVLLTPVYVAGAIAVEKERKTLEFLFATDLRNAEIVFGKAAARVGTILLYLLAGLPVVGLIQLFGGVDPNELLAAFAVTVVSVLAVAAVGTWMSVRCRRARDAIVLTYLAVVLYVVGTIPVAVYVITPAAGAWWQTPIDLFGYNVVAADAVLGAAAGNPVWGVIRLDAPPFVRRPMEALLKEFLLFWAVAGTAILAHAVYALRAVALAQSYGPPAGTRTRKKTVVRPDGIPAKVTVNERRHAYPPVGDNPVLWKEVFVDGAARSGVLWRVMMVLVAALVLVPAAMIFYHHFVDRLGASWDRVSRDYNEWVRLSTGLVGTLVFFAVAIRAAGAVSGERDRDTWVSLLGTPVTADSVLWGKFWGCVFGQRRAVAFLAVLWSVALVFGGIHPAALPLMLLATAIYLPAFAWVGLYCSMTARNTLVASVRAFAAALFMAGGFWVLVGLFCALPLTLFDLNDRDAEPLYQLIGGATPAFVYGWLPLRHFTGRELEPFDSSTGPDLGLTAPVIGLIAWAVFDVLAAMICLAKFRRVTNRVPHFLPGERQLRAEYEKRVGEGVNG